MFLKINDLSALIIDLNSFNESEDIKWKKISREIRCVFIVNDKSRSRKMKEIIGDTYICKEEHGFLSQSTTLRSVTKMLRVSSSEMAYVSKSTENIKSMMDEPVGTIYIKCETNNPFPYSVIGFLPDFCLDEVEDLSNILENGVQTGYISEMISAYGTREFPQLRALFTAFEEPELLIFVGGRYYRSSHFSNKLNPLSRRILKGKKDNTQDRLFSKVFEEMVKAIHYGVEKVDAITRIPPKPSDSHDRFKPIVSKVSRQLGILNMSEQLRCIEDYKQQKKCNNEAERVENVKGKFFASSEFNNKHVVLLDDVISTGSTVKECGKMLFAAGAKSVTVVVLAANQLGHGPLFSGGAPCLAEDCKGHYDLRINGSKNNPFYGCSNYGEGCRSTMEFQDGWEEINKYNAVKWEEVSRNPFIF